VIINNISERVDYFKSTGNDGRRNSWKKGPVSKLLKRYFYDKKVKP
jgi:hypothetical protein